MTYIFTPTHIYSINLSPLNFSSIIAIPRFSFLTWSVYLYTLLLILIDLEFKGFIFCDLGKEFNKELERVNFWFMDLTIMSRFKRVCVFCGSNSGHRQVFSDAAMELGNELVNRKIDLVYGGGSVGLMGLISQRVHNGGCHVLGVIPKALVPLEISGEAVGEVRVVSDMHERKALMAREADAFIALPGGYGTMEEVLEMITWAQLGIHKKPVGLLNVDGYYNSLLALFDNGVEEGFIKPTARDIVLSAPTTKELLDKMEQYTPSHDHIAPHESWQMEQLVNHKIY